MRVGSLGGDGAGVDWRADSLVFASGPSTGLARIPAAGGATELLTVVHPERGEKSHRFPQFLPGGESVLFTLGTTTTESWDDGFIAVGSTKTREYKVVLEGGAQARYSATGHLLYARRGSLFAVTFDLKKLEVTGQPVVVVPQVTTYLATGAAEFALGENGSLVYAPGLSRTEYRRVVWIDREAKVEPLIETPRPFIALKLSPDGGTLALQVHASLDAIWLYEIARGTLTRWTFEWDNALPVWNPSGREIAFTSPRRSGWNPFRRAVDARGNGERLVTSDRDQYLSSWSPDGAVLAFHEGGGETGDDIWMLPLSGDGKPQPFLNGRANEAWPVFSPNGKWIAYQSDETGQFEIYVRQFPGGGGMRQVSTGGGIYPVWNPNGKELFYRSGDTMMAVAVETEGELVLGRPAALFERRYPRKILGPFAVTPDGRRFIDLDESVAEPAPTDLVLVQNFSEELRRLAPPPK